MITDQEGHATYRALAESLPQLVWMATARGVITYSNRAFLQYTGLSAGRAASGWPEIVHPDDRDQGRQAWLRAAERGEACQTEVRLRSAAGEYRWHAITAVPMAAEQSDVAWLGTAIDIHARKTAERELAETQRRYDTLVRADSFGVIYGIADAILEANDEFLRIVGRTREQFERDGLTWQDVTAPGYEDIDARAYEQCRERGTCDPYEKEYVRLDGSRVPVLLMSAIIEQEPYRWICVVQDVSERTGIEQALQRRAAQQSSISRIGTLALQAGPLQDLCDAAVREISLHLDVEYAKVLELTPPGDALLLRAGVGWREGLVGQATVSAGRDSQAGYTLMRDEPIVVRELPAEARFTGPPLLTEHGVTSGMSVVIHAGSRPWGVLGAHSKRQRSFTDDDVHYLQSVANVLGQAILRQQSEEALRDSEERARAVLETAVDSILVIDEHGIIDSVNPAVERLFGYTAEELRGQNVSMLMPPPDRDQHDGYIRRYVETGEPHIIGIGRDVTGRRKDGSTLALHLSVAEMHFGDRRMFTGILRDISKEKRIEAALRESQQQLAAQVQEMRTLVELAPVGIGIAHDPECRFIETNGEFARILRIPPSMNSSLSAPEGERPSFRIFRDGQQLDASELPIQLAARTGEKTEPQQLDIVFDDGEVVHEYGMAAPLFDSDGRVTGAIGAFMDITDQVRAQRREQVLADVSRRLTELSTDKERLFQLMSDLLTDVIGDTAAVRLARPDGTLDMVAMAHRDPAGIEMVRRLFDARPSRVDDGASATVFQTGELLFIPHVSLDDLRASLPEDYWPYLERFGMSSAIIAPLTIEGEVVGVLTATRAQGRPAYDEQDVALVRAIAERASVALHVAMLYEEAQRTAEELRIANNAKDEFLGLVSHELKTPITTIVGNAEILSRPSLQLDESDRLDALRDIVDDGRRLSRIIDDLLVLARLDRGVQIEIEPVSVDAVVRRVADEHARRFTHRRVPVSGEARAPVLANEGYLEQIVRNLVSNAEKYSPPDQPVELSVTTEGTEATVRVLDRGGGVPPDERDEIFSPFYRAKATENEARGIGIGLSVCKRLVEAQGGRIWVCDRDGGGSEFGFTLPLAP